MTITTSEYQLIQAKAMPEAALLQHVRDIGRVYQWLAYHTHRSERSEPGFPDLVLIHPKAGRIVFAELKRQDGHLTEAQQDWNDALLAVWDAADQLGYPKDESRILRPVFSAYIWRPLDLLDGTIEAVLRP